MTTQLRLVETTVEPGSPATPGTPATPGRPRRARTRRPGAARRSRRTVHWPEWRLDDRARHVGRQGIAQARAALAESQPPARRAPLPRAS